MEFGDLKSQYQQYADRLDALSLRERGIVFIAILGALYFIAVNLMFTPLQKEKDKLQGQVQTKREQIQIMEVQLQGLLSGGSHDPDAAKREKFNTLQQTLKDMDAALAKATTGLVSPKEMAPLVEKILMSNRGLKVMKVESLVAAPLLESAAPHAATEQPHRAKRVADAGLNVYKHGLRIELSGSYPDLLRYLRALEGLPWKVFWGQVSLQTDKYPVSHMSLVIYTLSTQEGWVVL